MGWIESTVAMSPPHHHHHKKRKKKHRHHHHQHYRPPSQQPPSRWKWILAVLAVSVVLVLGLGLGLGLRTSSSKSPAPAQTYSVTILNQPIVRTDVYGNAMDIHDGNVVLHNGLYYMFGVMYGSCEEPQSPDGGDLQGGDGGLGVQVFAGCADGTSPGTCGSRLDHNLTAYVSPDLVSWTPINGPGPGGAIIFNILHQWPEPCVAYVAKALWNDLNQEFVMWLNWNTASSVGYSGVLTSPDAVNWVIQTTAIQTFALGASYTDDFGFLIDDGGLAYVVYAGSANLSPGHYTAVEQLTNDFYGTLGEEAWSGVLMNYTEVRLHGKLAHLSSA